jgi:rare lipoprotein A
MKGALATALMAATAACGTTHGAPPPAPPTTSTAPPEPATAPTTAPPPQVAAPPPSPRSAEAPAGVVATSVPPAPDQALPGDESVGDAGKTAQEQAGQTTRVSWYGVESGSRTADGTPFDGTQMVFAHRSMAFGTMVRFCGPLGCVVARCADRGPFIAGRLFDLSRAAFAAIAPLGAGVVDVTWEAA